MNARMAKHIARGWVEQNLDQWPGLRAAHLVGGVTSLSDDAAFPRHKDLDMHLIFDEGSTALQAPGPYPNILEYSYRGLSIEAGVKSVAEYASAETVLANPEIAYHFTVDSVLYDPSGLLGDLRPAVQRDYRRRRWVQARIDHERRGLAGAFALLEMAVGRWRPVGEALLFGYTTTFAAAVLAVAAVQPPKMGGRVLVRLRESLAAHDRLDLYDELLDLMRTRHVDAACVEHLLREAAEAFDLAVEVRTSPHPFQHKLHRHLQPYFVESCRVMLDEGYHREALGWITPFYVSTCDVILTDGPETLKPRSAERQARFLARFGIARVVLLVLCRRAGVRPVFGRLPALLGLTGITLPFVCQNVGLQFATAVDTTLVIEGGIPILPRSWERRSLENGWWGGWRGSCSRSSVSAPSCCSAPPAAATSAPSGVCSPLQPPPVSPLTR